MEIHTIKIQKRYSEIAGKPGECFKGMFVLRRKSLKHLFTTDK